MTERQLFDAIVRKAKQKFEDITETQLKAVAESAWRYLPARHGGLNDTTYAEVSTRSGVRRGRSKRRIAQSTPRKASIARSSQPPLMRRMNSLAAVVFARNAPSGRFAAATSIG